MSVVKINRLSVPEGQGAELERRFAARRDELAGFEGYQGFELLRPVRGEDRYYVITRFDTEENFQAWRQARAEGKAHAAAGRPSPISSAGELVEFEVVDLDAVE